VTGAGGPTSECADSASPGASSTGAIAFAKTCRYFAAHEFCGTANVFGASVLPPALRPKREESSDFLAMNLLAPPRRFDPSQPEMIDRPGIDQNLLRDELRLLERTNERLGGHQLVLDYAQSLIRSARLTSLNILDLATGAADIPRAVVAWARARQLPVTITAVDVNANVLRVAMELCQGWPEIRLEHRDILSLSYAANSFDLVLCSLALHHFGWSDAVAILRRMQELARAGYVLNDLRRNRLAIWGAELLARTVIRNSVFREDAPQSCRAAFTVGELRAMAGEAELKNFRIKRHHAVFRMVLEGRK
jgi:2-polyprenyl-3-methyl-5-hydroxy-6-metoxy-1,4-benzoquinol methylase